MSSTQKCAPSPPRASRVDSLRVAVLAALNIADELAALEQRYNALVGTEKENVRSRASRLSGLLDAVLTEDRKIG